METTWTEKSWSLVFLMAFGNQLELLVTVANCCLHYSPRPLPQPKRMDRSERAMGQDLCTPSWRQAESPLGRLKSAVPGEEEGSRSNVTRWGLQVQDRSQPWVVDGGRLPTLTGTLGSKQPQKGEKTGAEDTSLGCVYHPQISTLLGPGEGLRAPRRAQSPFPRAPLRHTRRGER